MAPRQQLRRVHRTRAGFLPLPNLWVRRRSVDLGELGLQFPTPSFPVPRMDRRPLHLLTLSHIFQVLAWTSLALALALAISAYVVLAPLL